MEISIEYCGTCNYRPIAAGLAIAIGAKFGVKPVLVHSKKMGVFEVVADGELIFSKKESGRFPDHSEILDILADKKDKQGE
ncbi:MAG: SelT/SelW/SelH family protein [Nitrospiraceae bacterium]|nr:MAG: SelT/SelW/SelH family protein [Nitrospiraceae bacterium]